MDSTGRQAYMRRQRQGLKKRLASSTRYLRTVEQLVAEHPGDTFYLHQLARQNEEVTRISAALDYASKT